MAKQMEVVIFDLKIRNLARRQRQRERRLSKYLMSSTLALHVRYTF